MDTDNLIANLERRLAYERMVAAASEVLLTGADHDLALGEVCRMAGETAGVSRCYIFENFDNNTRTCNTIEWTAPGIAPVKDELQDVAYDGIRYWKITLENGEMIRADNILTLPADVVEILTWQGIDSLLAVPLRLFDRFHGFLGFDVCGSTRTWEDDEVAILATVARLVSAFLERELLRQQLVRSSRLSAVGSLAAGIGHEFNNIHAGIRGLAELAQEAPGLPPKVSADLTRILGLVDRGVHLTRRLLGLSKQRPATRPIDLKQIVEDVSALLVRTFAAERIEFEFTCALPNAWILGTPAELGHVLLSLLQNAAEALRDAPERRISVDLQQVNASLFMLSVCDTGPGIPEAALHSVFEPFFTTKGKLGGGEHDNTGLGLSVSASIVSQLGGRLTAGNQPHHGACFTLELPASSVVRRLVPEARQPAPTRRAGRIGILDDEPGIVEMLERFLRSAGHHVESFARVPDACAAISSRRYDVFLLDLVLQDRPGRDLLLHVATLPARLRPGTIIMTGQDEQFARQALADVEFDAFVQKPFPSLRELGQLVVSLLERRPGDSGTNTD